MGIVFKQENSCFRQQLRQDIARPEYLACMRPRLPAMILRCFGIEPVNEDYELCQLVCLSAVSKVDALKLDSDVFGLIIAIRGRVYLCQAAG
jgi:hypothetical protein